jgi:NADH-quinone oxidoreductase subunit C
MNLSNELVLARFEQEFPGVVKASETGIDGILAVEIDREQVADVLRKMRDDSVLQFNFLSSLNGMHFPQNEGRELGVVYHLHNWVKNFRMRVKIFFPISNPHVPTLTGVWPTANWMERQEYDFFGIVFDGHPDLRRILNVDDLDVFPMRKEYKMEDGTRTDKDDRFFGRDGHEGRSFD